MFKIIKTLVAIGTLALMTACGGGGGGGGSAPVASSDTFPLPTILNNSLQSSSNTFTISGTSSGAAITGSGTVTRGSLSAGTFEGLAAQQRTSTVTGNFSVNGTTYPLNSSQVDWFDSNNMPVGESGGTDYIVVTGGTIPATVRVNDTGTLYTANRYTNNTKSALRGTLTVTYVVEADTTTTALLTLIRTEKDNSNNTTSTNSAQVRITPAGALTRIKETSLEGSTSLVINY
jgi:hypothetical protein